MLHIKLHCIGHWGYTSGWQGTDYCLSCPVARECRAKLGEVTSDVVAQTYSKNHVFGSEDRVEKIVRWTSVRTHTFKKEDKYGKDARP